MLSHLKKRYLIYSSIIAIVAVLSIIGLNFQIVPAGHQEDKILGTSDYKVTFTIGNPIYASGQPDYVCDGIDDDIQFQGAMNALPATGGRLVVLGGTYNFSNVVTRAIANISIEGVGQGTYLTRNGVNPLFIAGGNNWNFWGLRTDAGGIDMGVTTGWIWSNVTINATYYTLLTDSTGNVTTGNIKSSALTSGQSVYAGASGLLSSEAGYEYNAGTNTLSVPTLSSTTVGATTLNAPTGRGASYILVTNSMSTTLQNQADEIATGTSMETAINAALVTLNATGDHEKLLLIGAFVCDGQINAVANVDVECIGSITIDTVGTDNGAYFNNVTNSEWLNVKITRTGLANVANFDYTHGQAVCIVGTCDSTLKFINCEANNTCTNLSGSFAGWVIKTATNPGVYFENCIGRGGGVAASGGGLNGQCNGFWITEGGNGCTLVNCKGYGGYCYWSNGITIEEPSLPKLFNCIGYGGTGTQCQGILFDNSDLAYAKGCIGYGGDGFTAGNGIAFWGSAPTLDGCTGVAGKFPSAGGTNKGISIEYGAAPILNGCTGIVPSEAYIWTYDDANNGRFRPTVTTSPFRIYTLEVSTLAANPGITLDIGTTVGGHEIAQNIDIATSGLPNCVFALARDQLAAGGYIYATPSGAIADGSFRVYYSVLYIGDDTHFYEALDINTTGFATINGGTFISGDYYAPTVNVQTTYKNWKMVGSSIWQLRFWDANALKIGAAMTNVPVYNTMIDGGISNVTSFVMGSGTLSKSGTWTVINTQTSVVVTHGLGWTPQAGDIAIGFTSTGNSATCYIDTYTATQFTVHVNADPGAATAVGWWKAIR